MNIEHEKKLNALINCLKTSPRGQIYGIRKSSVSHFVPDPSGKRDRVKKIDLSAFTDILEIDPDGKTCIAESGVTFFDLTSRTMKYNLIPYTVPELKGITIGGAVSGCSVESMSYKYGGFHDSCIEYELVTAGGEAVTCSRGENADLFNMIHGSYGTLGLLTKIKFRLMPARPCVRVKYVSFKTCSDFWTFLKERCSAADYDFIDGIIHAKDKFVVCLGQMVDAAPYKNSYNWLKIYYKSTAERSEDYLSLCDYLFRFDAECHWLTRTVPFLENRLARLLLGKMFLGSTNLIKWSKRLGPVFKLRRRPDVVVDVFIPSGRFPDFYSWYENVFDFYPLWIVPYRMGAPYPWINREYADSIKDDLFIDCAIYGRKNGDPQKDYSEMLEEKVYELNGLKTLISRNHYSRERFWNIYDHENYSAAKAKVDPAGLFSDLYEKFAS